MQTWPGGGAKDQPTDQMWKIMLTWPDCGAARTANLVLQKGGMFVANLQGEDNDDDADYDDDNNDDDDDGHHSSSSRRTPAPLV